MSHPRDMYVGPSPPGEAPPPPPPGPAPPMQPFGVGSYLPPPLPPGLPPGVPPLMYAFGANNSAPLPGFSFQPSHGPFVRFPGQVYPSGPNQMDALPPPQGPSRPYEERRRGPRPNRRERPRGRPGIHAPSQRPLLTSERDITPEPMSAMTEDNRGGKRFISLDDLSDSQEEEMDVESQSEAGPDDGNKEGGLNVKQSSTEDPNEPPKKRRARGIQRANDTASLVVPKWSNPDPYTTLPPLDESQKKKKDVVKLIRKARIASTHRDSPSNGLEANADFISLNFGDEVEEDIESNQEYKMSEDTPSTKLKAPSGPRSLGQTTQNMQPLSASGADDALGSRKRTHRDEIKDMGPPQPRADNRVSKGPEILRAWRAEGNVNPVPWCDVDHSTTQNLGFWLHKEICDFYSYVRPRKFEQEVREDLLQRLRSVVVSAYPDCDIRCFGSFSAGIYMPTADMDVVCVTKYLLATGRTQPGFFITEKFLRKFARYLESKGLIKPGSIELIPKARVPLVKFVDALTNLRVDMSFENPTGLVAIDTYLTWKLQFPAMPIIVTIIKQFLAMRGLHEVRSGGLGGFSITCMVTSLLQNMPQVQSGSMIPENHLGDILMEFLDLYGKKFNTFTTGIRLSPPGYFDKLSAPNQPYRKRQNIGRLTIEDPNNSNNDISGGSSNINMILSSFSRAYDTLQEKMFELHRATFSERRGQSLLGTILAGNYSSFEVQRDRLKRVHEGRSDWVPGPPPIVLDNTVQRLPGGGPPKDDGNAKEAGPKNDIIAPPLPIRGQKVSRYNLASINIAKKNAAAKKKKIETEKKKQEQKKKTEAEQKSKQEQKKKKTEAEQKNKQEQKKKQEAEQEEVKVRGQQRAQMLRDAFPHIQNIPTEVSRRKYKTLLKRHETSAGVPSDLQQGQASDKAIKVEETKPRTKRQRTPEQNDQELQNTPMQKRIRASEEPESRVLTRSMRKRLGQELSDHPPKNGTGVILTRSMRRRLKQELSDPPPNKAGMVSTLFTGESSRHFPSAETFSTQSEGTDKSTEPWMNQLLQAAMLGSNDSDFALSVKRETSGSIIQSISDNNYPQGSSAAKTGAHAVFKVEDNENSVKEPQWTPLNTMTMAMGSMTMEMTEPGPKVKNEFAPVPAPNSNSEMDPPAQSQTSGAGAHVEGNDSADKVVKEEVGKDAVGASIENAIMLD